MKTHKPDLLVIGAGLGGLLTACAAAQAGARVVVVDGHDVGGRARALPLGGVLVNTGPRALYRGGGLDRALRSLNIRVEGFRPPAAGFGCKDGALQPLPTSPASLLSTSLLSSKAKKEAALALARITVGAFDVVDGEAIGAWIARHTSHDDARMLVEGLARVSTYCPIGVKGGCGADDVDAAVALANMRAAFTRGVLYNGGDWCKVVDAVFARAVALGVVVDKRSVDAIDDEDAGHVVVAGSPQTARSLASVPSSTEPVYASCLDLVLARLPVPAHRFVLGVDRPLYFSVHSPPQQASPVVVHVLQYGGGASRDDLEAFVDVVQPGWRDVVRGARFLPKMVVMHDRPVAGKKSPDVVVDNCVSLVGDWVDGSGLIADRVADTALAAAAALSTKKRAA